MGMAELAAVFDALRLTPWPEYDWASAVCISVPCAPADWSIMLYVADRVLDRTVSPMLETITLEATDNILVCELSDPLRALLQAAALERGLTVHLNWRLDVATQSRVARELRAGPGRLLLADIPRCSQLYPLSALHTLDLSHQNLVDGNLRTLVAHYPGLSQIRHLNLSYNSITVIAIMPLVEPLLKQLLVLNLDYTLLSERAIYQLLTSALEIPGLWFSATGSVISPLVFPSGDYTDNTLRELRRTVIDRVNERSCAVGGSECKICLPPGGSRSAGTTCSLCLHTVDRVTTCRQCQAFVCSVCMQPHIGLCWRSLPPENLPALLWRLRAASETVLNVPTGDVILGKWRADAGGVIGECLEYPTIAYKLEMVSRSDHLLHELLVAQHIQSANRVASRQYSDLTTRWPEIEQIIGAGTTTLQISRTESVLVRYLQKFNYPCDLHGLCRRVGRFEFDTIERIMQDITNTKRIQRLLLQHVGTTDEINSHLFRGLTVIGTVIFALSTAASACQILLAHGLIPLDWTRSSNLSVASPGCGATPIVLTDLCQVFGTIKEPRFLERLTTRDINEAMCLGLRGVVSARLDQLLAFAGCLERCEAVSSRIDYKNPFYSALPSLRVLQADLTELTNPELHGFPNLSRHMRHYYEDRITRTEVLGPVEIYVQRVATALALAGSCQCGPAGETLSELGRQAIQVVVGRTISAAATPSTSQY